MPQQSDMLDSVILLVGVLFLMSIIAERVANFIKLHFSSHKEGKWYGWGNLRLRETSELAEKQREKRIMFINIACGFIVALCLNANLIEIFGGLSQSSLPIGWENPNFKFSIERYFIHFVGWVLTGLFISLGSKFWHDLLDMLYEVKKHRSLLNKTVQADLSKGDFGSLDIEQQHEVIRDAIHLNFEKWKSQYSGITGVSSKEKTIGGNATSTQSIVFQVSKKDNQGDSTQGGIVPEKIFHAGYFIPTDVEESSESVLLASYCGSLEEGLMAGASISPNTSGAGSGTICLKVKKTVGGVEKFFALTCCHVVVPDKTPENYFKFEPGTHKTVSPSVKCGGKHSIGSVYAGSLNHYVDAAIVELENPESIKVGIKKIGDCRGERTLTVKSEGVTQVRKMGMMTGLTSGKLISISSTQAFDYRAWHGHKLHDLLQLKLDVEGGDSGAVVVDMHERVLGMIVGKDNSYSYAIPIQSILTSLNITLQP
jgi:hypothetical protein